MAPSKLVLALSAIAAVWPVAAASADRDRMTAAPAGTAETRYCMRIVVTGSLIEPLRCWTRAQWAEQGVDVDRDWPREGVRTIG